MGTRMGTARKALIPMGRRRSGLPIHGWVNLDKPEGVTSTQAVAIVQRVFQAQKAGHGGTLDPLASGILPIALGEATKTVPYVMDASKTYRITVRWGEERSTDDREGAVTSTAPHRPDRAAIEAALPRFIGCIEQIPPAFSAIKVAGKRAYDLARSGEVVDLKPRPVQIEAIVLEALPDADHAVLRITSGKGVYMRSLARDLARALGTVGHVSDLRRLSCGPFREETAISLDKLQALGHSPPLADHLLPVLTGLDDIPALALTEEESRALASGQALSVARLGPRLPSFASDAPEPVLRAMDGNRLVAVARVDGGAVRPVRVLNL